MKLRTETDTSGSYERRATPLPGFDPLANGHLTAPDARHRPYLWSVGGVLVATGCFWLVHDYVDKGQASLLYLPVVIACAIRLGFGPSVLAALLSFLCWNFFFLPPAYTFHVQDPKDWLSLFVFLIAAVTTAQLAARAKQEADQAQEREAETATLFEASAVISREVSAPALLDALGRQFQVLCHASRCVVWRRAADGALLPVGLPAQPSSDAERQLRDAAVLAIENGQVVGFEPGGHLWQKAGVPGVFLPLRAADVLVGVLHVGQREDGKPFSPAQQRLIRTLATHAATVIARERLAEQAAQAAALREADALKDALLSLVSHELRTPLAAIKASVSGLLQPGGVWDETDRMEAMTSIDREADRLTTLINHLLDLSRLEGGAWLPALEWGDLTEPDLPLIRADYIQIAQALQNLLENADTYAPGDAPIEVRLSPDADKGVVVTVRDFGEGIAPGEENQLFTRFFRGHRHRNGPVHGTGLGLALCEAIIRAHGGSIRAENAPASQPSGAIFSFRLPRNDDMP